MKEYKMSWKDIVTPRDSKHKLNEDGRKMSPLKNYKTFSLFWTMFYMNWECTRSCTDCFAAKDKQAKILETANDNNLFKTRRMSDENFEQMMKFLVDAYYAHNFAYSVYVFMGGEPLLEYDRIIKITENSKKHNLKGIYTHLQTNLDLIDEIDLTKLPFPTLVSFNATDLPFEEIDRRCKILSKYPSTIVNIDLNMTCYESNLERVPKLAEYAVKNGYNPIIYRNQFMGNDENYVERFKEALHKYCDVLERLKNEGYRINTKKQMVDFLLPHAGEDTVHICGRNMMTIFPDGSLGSCVRALEHRIDNNIYGDAKKAIEQIREYDYLISFKSDHTHEECKTCDARFTCHGGCNYDKFVTYGEISNKHKSPWCKAYKEIVPRLEKLSEGYTPNCIEW